MNETFPKLFLNKGKERSLLHFHPWVFSGAIAKKERELTEGEVVEVYSSGNEYLATGHYHSGSISVRIFSFQKTTADAGFWKSKLKKAYENRIHLGFGKNKSTNAFRLIHGEGDGMPGMIMDYYNGVVVMQAHTTGMNMLRQIFADALKELLGEDLKAVYDKTLAEKNSAPGEYVFKSKTFSEADCWISENENKFFVNWEEGQKTGFFLDQRENRNLLKALSKGKKVLNTFAYSGGFSVYSLAGGAQLVHSVDSSAKAAEWAEKNIQANFPKANHQFFCGDVFDFLKKSEEDYDIMVLDPPAFAKRLSALKQACSGYQRLNEAALKKIKPGGILFTFSCSQVIDRKLFRQILFSASASSKRNVTILYQLSQPPDHPVSIYHPEGEYLKGLVLRVD